MAQLTVRKLDPEGREVWRYTAKLLDRGPTWVCLEALFNRADLDAGYVVFRQNDRFVEWFYSDRWYNVMAVHDVSDGHLKGWYCNFTRPAELAEDVVTNVDLALDMWIDPTGKTRLLDEDEFEALALDTREHRRVLQAVDELRARVERREAPFDKIG
jgi:uncharacterized protein